MVWYSHLFQNFPQFIVIHTVKGLGIVSKAEIDVFLELSPFSQGFKIADLIAYINDNFQMFKLVLEKAEEPEIKLATSSGSWKSKRVP